MGYKDNNQYKKIEKSVKIEQDLKFNNSAKQ